MCAGNLGLIILRFVPTGNALDGRPVKIDGIKCCDEIVEAADPLDNQPSGKDQLFFSRPLNCTGAR